MVSTGKAFDKEWIAKHWVLVYRGCSLRETLNQKENSYYM